jgi:surface-anchored protein
MKKLKNYLISNLNVRGFLLKGGMTGALLAAGVSGQGKTIVSDGHGDVGAHYENGIWRWSMFHDGDPADYIVGIDNDGKLQIPDLPAFSFLGSPGENLWVISQSDSQGVPFLGMSSDTPGGVFENNRLNVHLAEMQGPGEFFMWTTSGAGQVNILMNSANGLNESDFINIPAPGHLHQNWGFTSPGTYTLGFQASGTLQSNSETTLSEVQPFEFAVNVLRDGEVDLEVLYVDGEWELALLSEGTGSEFEPEEAALHVSPQTWTVVPSGSAFDFLGAVDSDLYILPQDEQEGVLFLGIAGDEIELGVFESDAVSLSLLSVEGPGNVFLYETDAFGAPEVYFNTADGVDENDVFPVAVGGHAHQNWAFTASGVYRVTLQASGILMGGSASQSDPATFLFEVFAPSIFETGELDIEVAYEDGELEVVALDEATERELALDEVVIRGLPGALTEIPELEAFEFLGAAGSSVYILPQEETEGLIFLGIAGDEIPMDVFSGNNVSLSLSGVSGPGEVFLYSIDAFGAPTVYFNSADGVNSFDVFPVSVGGHAHQNWAFSAPGVYEVKLRAAATQASDSSEVLSEIVTLRFHLMSVQTGPDLMIELSGNDSVRLSWNSMNGTVYQLQSASDLEAGDWQDEGDSVTGTGGIVSIEQLLSSANSHRFLRLKILEGNE